MKKILISGYYGFGNIGDEAILKALIEELKTKDNAASITVLSHSPKETAEKFGVEAVDRSSIIKLVSNIKKHDVLISGGGSLLQESTSKMSIFYYLFIYLAAYVFRKKVIIYSQGIGPVYRSFSKKLIKFFFNRSSHISVRDERSKEELLAYGIQREIEVTADPVIGFEPFDKAVGTKLLVEKGLDTSKPTIGFALKESKKQSIQDKMTLVINKLQEHYNVVLVPFHFKEDMKLVNVLSKRTACISITERQSVESIFSIMSNFDVLVAVRLHALVFGAVNSTPLVGLSYDPKIDAFLNSIGMNVVDDIDDFDENKLIQAVKETYKNRMDIRNQIHENILLYKQQLSEFNQKIDSVLE